MPVPDFQTLMLPFLQLLQDGKLHSYGEIADRIADHYQLSDDDRRDMIPSKRQTKLMNRIYWASTYLRKSLVIEQPTRGYLQISERGRNLLTRNLPRIDMKTLEIFPEYIEFREKKNIGSTNDSKLAISLPETKTPDEVLYESYMAIRETLATELLDKIMSCSSVFFERLVVELLVAMGYGGTLEDAGQRIGKSGDGGIDGIIKEDRLGLDKIYIQAKRWDGTVSRPEIQKFAGALLGNQARKGVFITTSSFSREARDYVKTIASTIILVDGETLAELMLDHNVGVSIAATYQLKKVDSDYFVEE